MTGEMMESYLYILLSALPMFVCAFWAMVFLFKYRRARKDQKILFWFMLTATVLYFSHFVFFNKIYPWIPLTDTLYNFATLAVYPIYYLYILSLTQKLRWKHGLILLPALLLSLVIGILYGIMPREDLRDFLLSYEYSEGMLPEVGACVASGWAHDLVKVLFAIQLVPILLYGLKKIERFRKSVAEYFSNTEENDLREIRWLLIFFVVTSVFSFVANLIGRVSFADSIALVAIPALLFSILLFAVGYVGWVQKFSVEDLMKESLEEGAAVEVEMDSKPLRKDLKRELDGLMEKEKLFLQPNLKLSEVAFALNTNRTYIYNALMDNGSGEHLSFSDYVNQYRIRYSLELLEKHAGNKQIEDMIYESGFASKAAFYHNFKKFVGMTPNQYLKGLH